MGQEESETIQTIFLGVGRRLCAARQALGFRRQDDFARFLGGFSRGQVSRVEQGLQGPPPEMMAALVEIVGLNANWLLTGEGEMWLVYPSRWPLVSGQNPTTGAAKTRSAVLQAEAKVAAFAVKGVYEAGFRLVPREDVAAGRRPPDLVPVLGRIAAGAGAETLEAVQYAPGDADAYIMYKGAPAGAVAVQVVGVSMEPEFREGDLVVVHAGQSAESGLACVIQRSGDQEVARLKRLRRVGRRLLLESTNPSFPPEDLARQDFVAARPVLAHLPLSRRTKGGDP